MKKIIPDFCVDLQGPGEAFEDIKQMGLSGETPLGVAKTKAINSDYHKPAEAWHAVVARGYLERAARVDELNGHSPGLRRAYGHRAQGTTTGAGCWSSFVMGAFVKISGDVSRICGIIAHDLAMARTQV